MTILRATILGLFTTLAGVMAAEPAKKSRAPAEVEKAVQLQVFLDRAEFGPGKIDGRYGEFTQRALALYREANGLPAAQENASGKESKKGEAESAPELPDLTGIDLAKAGPAFTDYTVTEEDAKSVGELPEAIPAQAKLKWLPYRTLDEAIAEKFHCDRDFLAEINPGKDLKQLKAGDVVKVPNVAPFLLTEAKEKADEESEKKGTNALEDADAKEADESAATSSISIDTATKMLKLHEGGQLKAAYPVTVGSSETASPIGEWKVRRAYHLPHFRYDQEMLKKGERSDDYHILRPGPNNLVGVVWVALNKKGIGIHGTHEPDTIGRSVSHGCIRLANWDVVRLAEKVRPGMAVSIH